MILIENPFSLFVLGWSWDDHIRAGFLGGSDYILYAPDVITAAADGRVVLVAGENGFTGGNAVILQLVDGRTINYRETGKKIGSYPRNVVRGAALAYANGPEGRWPHIDATVDGERVPFETLVNSGLQPAGGGGTPVPNFRSNDMATLYHDISTKPLLFALAGDSPGTPANWLQSTSLGTAWAIQHGNSAPLSHDTFLAFKADYLSPITTKS